MAARRLHIIIVAVLFVLCALAAREASRHFAYPLGRTRLSPLPQYVVQDLAGTLAGARRIAADVAWIQLLQYYGSPEKPMDKDTEFRLSVDMTKKFLGMQIHGDYDADYEGGVYPLLLTYCVRITNLDPFFTEAYLYGAGALAWNLKRPQEAIELLQSGIKNLEGHRQNITNDPRYPFWQFNLYTAAIIYRNKGEFDKMVSLLEVAVRQPHCPNIVRSILANIYQQKGQYARALKLWIDVSESGDATYSARSAQKIAELRSKLGI